MQWEEYFTPQHFIGGKDKESIELLAFLLFVVVNKFHYLRAGPAAGFALPHAV